jgi:hypothetical protein
MNAGPQQALHQSFLSVARYRYALYAAALGGVCAIGYIGESWRMQPRGDTVLGYTLGGVAAILVLFLMSYGIRRRSFRTRAGSTRRWLSMHVYMGVCALLVATLHAGLQWRFSVHSLAYALLCLVVLSGCWGVYAYLRYPTLMLQERGAVSREVLLARIAEFDEQALAIAARSCPEALDLVADAVRRTRLGGSVWEQLRGRDTSMLMVMPVRATGYAHLVSNRDQQALIAQLAKLQAISQDGDSQEVLHQLLKISGAKAVLVRRVQRDIRLQGMLQFWLHVHVPLSFALLAALAVHIFSVFYYW